MRNMIWRAFKSLFWHVGKLNVFAGNVAARGKEFICHRWGAKRCARGFSHPAPRVEAVMPSKQPLPHIQVVQLLVEVGHLAIFVRYQPFIRFRYFRFLLWLVLYKPIMKLQFSCLMKKCQAFCRTSPRDFSDFLRRLKRDKSHFGGFPSSTITYWLL